MPAEIPSYVQGPLRDYWEKPVSDLAETTIREIPEPEKERHRIYSYLLSALIYAYWNGNKRGNIGTYPWRERQKLPNEQRYKGGDYFGHNIAAIAVDAIGEVIDFDFNHNELMNSSVEHAESRLVRRVFSLTQIYDNWETRDKESEKEEKERKRQSEYGNMLRGVTLYTSLESCSQCAGIMALGQLKEVFYLQRDPGMYQIGNILRNLTKESSLKAPLPIPGSAIGLTSFEQLHTAYDLFAKQVADKPFHDDGTKKDTSPSITSFLCTDAALAVFEAAAAQFESLELSYKTYRPGEGQDGFNEKTLTNEAALQHCRRFFYYARTTGRRGTPHRL